MIYIVIYMYISKDISNTCILKILKNWRQRPHIYFINLLEDSEYNWINNMPRFV